VSSDRLFTGIGLRLIAILCLASMAALIKLAEAGGATLAEIMFFRQLAAIPVVVAFVAAGDGLATLRTTRFKSHAIRTGVGLIGMVANFGAILLLPLAEAQTLAFTAPIFATILGALWLREKTGWHRWGAVIAGFVGVVIVAQPGSGHFPLVGALVGLFAAFMVASVSILLRQLTRSESASTTVFYFSLLSVPVIAPFYAVDSQAHGGWVWVLLIAIGVIGGMGQIALTAALRFAPVSTVVPMDYSGLVWATLYGWLLFGVLPGAWTWVGAPIIIASGLYIVWREHRLRKISTPAIGE
jgi:drug/metabolite transporter (DMT)-like permease